MNPRSEHSRDPRWGAKDRPRKADAIWQTLVFYAGNDILSGTWVDMGCGSGGIAAALAPKVKKIIGIDPEPWSRWSTWTREHSNLEFIEGSYENDPPLLAENSVDIVICNQVYEHVPDPQQMIKVIYRILKPGGYCYFAGPNLLFPIEPHVFWPIIHWIPRAAAINVMKAVGAKDLIDANSTTYWTLRSWLNSFEIKNALPDVIKHPEKYGRKAIFWRCISIMPRWLAQALTPISPGFVFVLRKPE